MKHSKDNSILANTTQRILEDWAMTLVDPISDISPQLFRSDEEFFVGRMEFRGEDILRGEISVLCQNDFMENLSRNLLGTPPDEVVELDTAKDSVKELTNVLTGNFLTDAYGEDTVFELFAPVVTQAREDSAELQPFFEENALAFSADGFPVIVVFSLEAA